MMRKHRPLTIWQFFHSPFFQLNCHFWGECAINDTQPTDRFLPCRHCRLVVFIKTERGGKRMVRKHCALTILQFFHSPFFQLNCHFWGECAINDIAAHRPMFVPSPLPPGCVYSTRTGRQKNGEKTSPLDNFAVLSLTIISIKLPFLGRMCNQWYRSRQTDVHPVTTATHLSY